MSRIILTAAEVQELTGKVRPSAQARYLALMGIAYTRRPDRNGTIVVYREGLGNGSETRTPTMRLPHANV